MHTRVIIIHIQLYTSSSYEYCWKNWKRNVSRLFLALSTFGLPFSIFIHFSFFFFENIKSSSKSETIEKENLFSLILKFLKSSYFPKKKKKNSFLFFCYKAMAMKSHRKGKEKKNVLAALKFKGININKKKNRRESGSGSISNGTTKSILEMQIT